MKKQTNRLLSLLLSLAMVLGMLPVTAFAEDTDHSAHSSFVVHVEAVEGNCTTPGNIEFWYCDYYTCEKCYSDEAMTEEISPAETIITPGVHSDACGNCGYTQKTGTFELFVPADQPDYDEEYYFWSNGGFHNSFSARLNGFKVLFVGEGSDGKLYAMSNVTNADGSRQAVELSSYLNEDGSVTVDSDTVEFFTYNQYTNIDTTYTFSLDNGYMAVMDGEIVVRGQNIEDFRVMDIDDPNDDLHGTFPQAIRFEQDKERSDYNAETGKGYLFSWSLDSGIIFFDPDEPAFSVTNWKSDNYTHSIMLYVERCEHENLIHTEGAELSCTQDGAIENWYCKDCQLYFADEYATEYIVLPEGEDNYEDYLYTQTWGHSYGENCICENCGEACPHTDAERIELEYEVEASCFEPGMSGYYWFCEECYRYLDKDQENGYWEPVDAAKIPATGHAFNPDTGECDNCGLPNPVYSKVTSLADVNEEDLYIIVAEIGSDETEEGSGEAGEVVTGPVEVVGGASGGKKYFVLGGLYENDPDREGNLHRGEDLGNAISVTPNEDGTISLLNQNTIIGAGPSEFMLDINPEQFDSGLSNFGLTTVMLKLPNYCVYPFQSYSYTNTGYMGIPRYANGEYGKWDGMDWVIDFYTTEVDENTYHDGVFSEEQGATHAQQIESGNIGENITKGDLLLYNSSFVSVGGAMFTLRLREYVNESGMTEYYFIAGEDWALEGSDGWDYETDTTPTNDTQYAVSLYSYNVEVHECKFENWEDNGDGKTHTGTCECGKSDSQPHNWENRDVIQSPSCIAPGQSNAVCLDCGAEGVNEIPIDPEAHNPVEVPASDPTCASTGLTAGTVCQNCGITLSGREPDGVLQEHTIVTTAETPAGCTTSGKTGEVYCEVCGVHFVESTYMEPLGHNWSEWMIAEEPTQTQHGTQFRYCFNGCGAMEWDISPARGHEHNLQEVAGQNPNCCTEGIRPHYVCVPDVQLLAEEDDDEATFDDSCGCLFVETEDGTLLQVTENDLIIPPTGQHDLGEAVKLETEMIYADQYRRDCLVEDCGYYEIRDEPKGHEHRLVSVPDRDPTCAQDGTVYNGTIAHYECADCHCLYADEAGREPLEIDDVVIRNAGHNYEKEETEKDWTQIDGETHQRTCTLCGHVQTGKHLFSPLPGDPTGETCAVNCLLCDYRLIFENGHANGAKEPCDDRWQHQHTCSNCQYTIIADHEFRAWIYGEYEQTVEIEDDGTEKTETVIGHYRICECGAMETSIEHLWEENEDQPRPGYVAYHCPVEGCTAEKVEFLRCMHTCAVCGKCTAETTCPGKEPCDCEISEPLPTVEPTFLTNNINDPNQTYLGDILVSESEELLPYASPSQEIPEAYVGYTVGIQEIPTVDGENGKPIENLYIEYVEKELEGYTARHLFDIHLMDDEGNIAEADENAQYLIRLCLDEQTVRDLQLGLIRLVHITETGKIFYGVDDDCMPFYKLEGTDAWFWAKSFSPFALVEPEAPYYGREALATLAKKDALLYAYDQIVMGVEACLDKITIYPVWQAPTLTIEELQMVMDAYTRDHTENFWLDTKYSISYKKSSGMASAVKPQYLLTEDELDEARAEFNAAVDELLEGIPAGRSEFERQLMVHDRLVANVTYDGSLKHAHDAYGAIVEGKAVCQGYAEAFQYLLRRVGIQSFIVTGVGINDEGEIPHAWNLVRIGEQYYHTDATWNDTADRPYHAYFNVSDQMITEDHRISVTAYPMDKCVGTESNYFTVKQTALTDAQACDPDEVADKLTGAVNGVSFLLTENITAYSFLEWFVSEQAGIFEAANLVNVEVRTPTYTCVGREAMISFAAENGDPPHICGQGTAVSKEDGKTATCMAAGWKDYYSCSCGRLYEEETCTTEITNLAVWKLGDGKTIAGHSFGALVDEVPSVHTKDELVPGVAAHYQCEYCKEYFTADLAPVHTTWNSLVIRPEHTYDGKADATCDCGYVREMPPVGISAPINDAVKGRITITFAWGTSISGKVMVAVYDQNGRMLGISYVENDMVDAGGKTYTVAYDKTGTPRLIRAFVLGDGFAPALAFDPIELP